MSTYKFNDTKLHTDYVFPPIPDRRMDWACIDDNYDGAPDAGRQIVGVGKTEQEAIINYFEELDNGY